MMGPQAQSSRMKVVMRWVLPGVVVCIMGVFAYAHFALLDGVRGLVLPIFFKDTTVYAVGYEENTFKHLRIGVNTTVVLQALGTPLQVDTCNGQQRWRYTESRSDSHYRVRQVTIENGLVVAKQSYFLVD